MTHDDSCVTKDEVIALAREILPALAAADFAQDIPDAAPVLVAEHALLYAHAFLKLAEDWRLPK